VHVRHAGFKASDRPGERVVPGSRNQQVCRDPDADVAPNGRRRRGGATVSARAWRASGIPATSRNARVAARLAWGLATVDGEASFEVGWFGGCELGEEHLGDLDFA